MYHFFFYEYIQAHTAFETILMGKKSFYHLSADDYCILHLIRFLRTDRNRTLFFQKVSMARIPRIDIVILLGSFGTI